MARRGFREDAIYFDHSGGCRDVRHHKGCPGRWRELRPVITTGAEVMDKIFSG
jgi:hypothetical protein